MGVVVPRAVSCTGTYRGRARPGPSGRSRPSLKQRQRPLADDLRTSCPEPLGVQSDPPRGSDDRSGGLVSQLEVGPAAAARPGKTPENLLGVGL